MHGSHDAILVLNTGSSGIRRAVCAQGTGGLPLKIRGELERPQIVCFDASFYGTNLDVAQRFVLAGALPAPVCGVTVRRQMLVPGGEGGFDGLPMGAQRIRRAAPAFGFPLEAESRGDGHSGLTSMAIT
jgi:hypothetical protein